MACAAPQSKISVMWWKQALLCGATASGLLWAWGPAVVILFLFSDYVRITSAAAATAFIVVGNLPAVMLVAIPVSLWRCTDLLIAVTSAALTSLVLDEVYCRVVFVAALFASDANPASIVW